MKVLSLSWEYPPNTVGGLATHVAGLNRALAINSVDVNVVTVGDSQQVKSFNDKGVNVYTVPSYPLPSLSFLIDIQHMNFSLIEQAVKLINKWGQVDIIHAHDWLVGYAARTLKYIFQVPLVTTIHATEYGRNGGLFSDLQHYISSVEWWLAYESWKVIVCSKAMQGEIEYIFQVPEDKIAVIPNGIEVNELKVSPKFERSDFALPKEKILFFIGRLVREKGVQVLISALPKVLENNSHVKLLIAGKGPFEEHLREQVNSLGLGNKVNFLGFIGDELRDTLYSFADCLVFPSIYEPFGIVALEGMNSGTPIIVSDTGGLREIVRHDSNGLKCIPDNANSLAEQIIRIFSEPDLATRLVKNAQQEVKTKYAWQGIAQQTFTLYTNVLNESKNSPWVPIWANDKGSSRHTSYAKLGRYEM